MNFKLWFEILQIIPILKISKFQILKTSDLIRGDYYSLTPLFYLFYLKVFEDFSLIFL